jgi:uncharacterized protein YndB with AHSA1/START domain
MVPPPRSAPPIVPVALRLARTFAAPPDKVYTWAWEEKPAEGETLVTVEFHDRGGRTEVVLIHERFPNEGRPDRLAV